VLLGVVFDMDGTMTEPNIDCKVMYERCGVTRSAHILKAIGCMAPEQAAAAQAIVEEMEEEGRRTLCLMPGAADLGIWLKRHGIRTALVTRNTAKTVNHFHEAVWQPHGLSAFQPAISRDNTAVPPKPDPAAFRTIAAEWGEALGPELLMVGDSPSNDVQFGKAAGVSTALLDTGATARAHSESKDTMDADLCVNSLLALPNLLWQKFHIEGALGTSVPLLKYDTPQPGTAAASAAASGDVTSLQSKEVAAELDVADASGNTPLIWAVDAGHVAAVEKLLEAGVSVNAKGYLGATAVSRACRRGHVDILRLLLSAPDLRCIDEPNDKMQSPLHFAAFKKQHACVDLMLARGASTTVLDRKGRTPAEDTSDENIRKAILDERTKRQIPC
jgi:phosphoglycolate phosphatase-like HAD superfamily hydrolase